MKSYIKRKWGIRVLIIAIILEIAAYLLAVKYPFFKNIVFYKKNLFAIGITFSVISFIAGHFSYPRVHNLRVYMLGFFTGLISLLFFLMMPVLTKNNSGFVNIFIQILAIVSILNIILVQLLPDFVKYRTTVRIASLLTAIEGIIVFFIVKTNVGREFIIVNLFENQNIWLKNLFTIMPYLLFLLSGFLSVYKKNNDFYLGGIFLGYTVMAFSVWIAFNVKSSFFVTKGSFQSFEYIMFAVIPFFNEISMIMHWFARMEHRISYDPLLQIYNRNYCTKIIEEQSNIKTTPPLAIAMVDIDHFKNVNDTYGHQAGDKVLHEVAQTILKEVIPQGIVCRYGGEEIIIFFPGKDTKKVKPVMENVRIAVEKNRINIGKKKINVTVSIGISTRESDKQSIGDIIAVADKALYRAKKGGRNQIKTGKAPKI